MDFDFGQALQALGTVAVLLYLAPHALKLPEPWAKRARLGAILAFAGAFGAALWGAARYFFEI